MRCCCWRWKWLSLLVSAAPADQHASAGGRPGSRGCMPGTHRTRTQQQTRHCVSQHSSNCTKKPTTCSHKTRRKTVAAEGRTYPQLRHGVPKEAHRAVTVCAELTQLCLEALWVQPVPAQVAAVIANNVATQQRAQLVGQARCRASAHHSLKEVVCMWTPVSQRTGQALQPGHTTGRQDRFQASTVRSVLPTCWCRTHLLGVLAGNGHVRVRLRVPPGCPLPLVSARAAGPIICRRGSTHSCEVVPAG